ncbi:MAG: sigma-70 family RNA polymerase sigma factor [Anaerolineales bacterium]
MAIGTACHSQGVGRFACAQAGCQDCLETLLQENKGLIQSVIQTQGMGGIDYADLVQEGRIGLWLAILHYDPARGYAFSTYAWTVIRYRLWRAHFYADRVDEVEEDWWQQHVCQALLEVVEKLPVRLGRLIRLAYGLDGQGTYCLAEIGREWGLSRERMRQLRNDALVLLRLPALSMQLRGLCERDSRQAYQQALALNRTWQRSQRRRR